MKNCYTNRHYTKLINWLLNWFTKKINNLNNGRQYMTLPEIKRRLAAIEQSQNQGNLKVFVNMNHDMDEQIERYKQEHPHDEIVIINVVDPNSDDD